MWREAIALLVTESALLACSGCGGPRPGEPDLPQRSAAVTARSSAEELIRFLEDAQHMPFESVPRIDQVGRLRTRHAKEALMHFAKRTGAAYYESMADAFTRFDHEISRELYEEYRRPSLAGQEGGNVRLVFALGIVRHSERDDWSLNALIDMCEDDYHEIRWLCKAALGRRPHKTLELMKARILEAKSDEERAELEELARQLKRYWRMNKRRLDYGRGY
ncbi:MAG: hypothetical protein ACYTFI_00675 [Planctomycetota bacterium]